MKSLFGIGLFIVGIFVIVLVLVIGGNRYFNSHKVIVKDGNKVVYNGEYACVFFKTAGSATHVKIFKQPLCIFLKDNIVSGKITVEGYK